jgi:hypothetical protein
MNMRDPSWALRRYGWLLLILLTAVFLRLHALPTVPPGLTHDEADHGLTAFSILNDGVRDIYFTVGYGREPLYDYLTAALMAGIGPTYLAGRLTAVYAGLLMIAAMIAWTSRAFNWNTALLTGAGLAVSFWPLMSARQGLRSILLPTLFVLAVLLFWRGLEAAAAQAQLGFRPATAFWSGPLSFIAAGVLLGLTFYTYIPARGLWLVFPALLLYWLAVRRDLLRHMSWRIALMLLTMFLVALPLLRYLALNPQAETRVTQLAGPLRLAQAGEFGPLAANISGALRLFFLQGDPTWRYNIAGKPFLGPVWGVLFVFGLALALRYAWRGDGRGRALPGSASFLSLTWLLAGFAPVLITGPELSMTQAIAAQPLLYLFPAVALSFAATAVSTRRPAWQPLITAVLLLFFAATTLLTYRDYFQRWANQPEVRVQYETALVTALDHIDQQPPRETAISTITPGRYHSPAVAQLRSLKNPYALRWFDARGALLLPRVPTATVVLTGFAPLHPALEKYFETAVLQDTLPLRETDLDRPLRFYSVDQSHQQDDWTMYLTPLTAQFGESLSLAGYELQTPQLAPGEQLSLVTAWQAHTPLPDAVLFTHLLGPDGAPVAQADRLDVPGDSWITGDTFLQLHQFTIPTGLPPGDYPLVVGVYTLPDGKRLPIDGTAATTFPLTTVQVMP